MCGIRQCYVTASPGRSYGGGGGYPQAKLLRKYSYPTRTFVILTTPRLAVGLGSGRWEYRCPSPVPQSRERGCNSLFDNLSRSAGVSAAGARRRNPDPERSRGGGITWAALGPSRGAESRAEELGLSNTERRIQDPTMGRKSFKSYIMR